MEQLTLGNIIDMATAIAKGRGLSMQEIRALPVYVSSDDEINGIHTAWGYAYLDRATAGDDEQWMIDLIDEDQCNVKMADKAIFIG